jgi:protein Mpv17
MMFASKNLVLVVVLLSASSIAAFAPQLKSRNNGLGGSLSKTRLNVFDISSPTLSAIDTFYQTQPYISAFLTCSVKASAADLVAQTRARITTTTDNAWSETEDDVEHESHPNGDNSFDLKRTLAFLLYGGFYQGMGQEYLYNTIFPSLFGHHATLQTVLMQVGLDTAVLAPFVCLPMVYMLKSGISGMTLPEGLQKYVSHIHEQALLLKYWAIWVPVQCLTFSVIPAHWRIAFVACVSFFWVCILSTISSSASSSAEITTHSDNHNEFMPNLLSVRPERQ